MLDDLLAAQRDLDVRAGEAEVSGRLPRSAACYVFSCWRLGEDAIRFWHGTTEGYAGRKPLSRLPGDRFH